MGVVFDLMKFKYCVFVWDLVVFLYKWVEVVKIKIKGSFGVYFVCICDIMKYFDNEKFLDFFWMVDIGVDFFWDFKIYFVDSMLYCKLEWCCCWYGDFMWFFDVGKKLCLWSSDFIFLRNFGCVDDGDKI